MEVLAAGAAWALSSTCRNVPTAQDWLGGICPRPQQDITELIRRLSDHAEILTAGFDDFEGATKRWSALGKPDVSIVVKASTAEDVAETVGLTYQDWRRLSVDKCIRSNMRTRCKNPFKCTTLATERLRHSVT